MTVGVDTLLLANKASREPVPRHAWLGKQANPAVSSTHIVLLSELGPTVHVVPVWHPLWCYFFFFFFFMVLPLKVDFIKIERTGLPWWRSGWESACQCRAHGFEPWSGKIPHAAEQLGPWATVTEPARLEPVLRNKRGRDSERPAHRDEEWPPLAAIRESPRTETKTQHSHK